LKRADVDIGPYRVGDSDLPLSGAAVLGLLEGVLSRGVPFRFRAGGSSMAPFIRDGDVISVSPFRGGSPGVGEVVAFLQPEIEKLIVHRVVGRREAGCLIRGDNAEGTAADLVSPRNILGRVTRVERGGHNVRIGLGPERLAIAVLSRAGLLLPMYLGASRLIRPFRKRSR
jgi:hypothetical protein